MANKIQNTPLESNCARKRRGGFTREHVEARGRGTTGADNSAVGGGVAGVNLATVGRGFEKMAP